MAEIPKVTEGRIVMFFSNKGQQPSLPTGIEKAPAIVSQALANGCVHLHIFAPSPTSGTLQAFTVPHKENPDVKEGVAYWDWPVKQ